MKKKPKLIIHGKLKREGHMPPKLREVMSVLENAVEHESFTGHELCRMVDTSLEYLKDKGCRLPPGYRFLKKNTYIYGNKKTIKNLEEGVYDEG